jgi:ABC-2 type transport system permease protein
MRQRIAAIIRKEFTHIFRDWRSLLIIILMPILMISMYGFAITMDMRNISYAVIDDAQTPESRSLISCFSENGFFVLNPVSITRGQIEHLFHTRAVQMVLVIPSDFSKARGGADASSVQLIIDASDSNVGTYVNSYATQVISIFSSRENHGTPLLFNVEPHLMYNPDMKSANFFVPGLIALILILISALLTSIAVTREKETGTLEQILVSPVRPFEIIIGKVAPYITLGFMNGAMILLFGWLLFGVPVKGSLMLLMLLSIVYIFVSLSFGLMISTVARSQQIAMLMTLMATILPTIMLSGFLFPIASMPYVLQLLSKVIPTTYFLVIVRGIMLKGVGLAELWYQASVLTGMGFLILLIATKRFKTTIE